MNNFTVLDIQKAIHAKLEGKIAVIVEEEARKASDRVRERIRGATVELAAQIASSIRFERNGADITIRIRLEGVE